MVTSDTIIKDELLGLGSAMRYPAETLRRIFDRTSGLCHICRRRLVFSNYGASGTGGAWEVEHSVARSLGGSGLLRNLYAACIRCNREKGLMSTRAARARHGYACAPLSRNKRRETRATNATLLGGLGLLIGTVLGPIGMLGLGALGSKLGYDMNPDK